MKSRKINREWIKEDPIPEEVLNKYLLKAGLHSIENGVDSFEVRNWYPFYYTDSFPIALERFYYANEGVKGEYYIFSKNKSSKITTYTDLENMECEKFIFDSISKKDYDSLKGKYSLFVIAKPDFIKIQNAKSNPASTFTPRKVFYEQATRNKYLGVFITQPNVYPLIDKSLDLYGSRSKFTFETICYRFPKFQEWYKERMYKVMGLIPDE